MMMGAGLIFLLVFLVVTVGLAVLVIARLFPEFSGKSINRQTPSDSALDILKQRYARGEISKGEYDEMSRVLQPK